jgi:hypothetical protein
MYMPKIVKTVYFPEELYHMVEQYARKRGESLNKMIITLIELGLDRYRDTLPEERVVKIEGTDAKHQMEEWKVAGTPVTKEEAHTEPTTEGKEEPIREEVATDTSEPVTELPLTGAPSKPVQEISSDFSWAKKTDKFDDLVKRWEATYIKWGIEDLVKTFKRCLDYPTRRAIINILIERFNGKLSETERATIWNFFKGEDVGKWLDENKLSIKVVEEGEKKRMVLEVV